MNLNLSMTLTHFGCYPLTSQKFSRTNSYSTKMNKNRYRDLMLISGCGHVPLCQITKCVTFHHPGFLAALTMTTWDEYLRGSRWSRGRQGRRESDSAALLADLLQSLWCRDWILIRAFFLKRIWSHESRAGHGGGREPARSGGAGKMGAQGKENWSRMERMEKIWGKWQRRQGRGRKCTHWKTKRKRGCSTARWRQTQQSGESEEKMTKRNNEEEDSQERSGSWWSQISLCCPNLNQGWLCLHAPVCLCMDVAVMMRTDAASLTFRLDSEHAPAPPLTVSMIKQSEAEFFGP